MKVAITGVDGRIGGVLRRHWQDRHELIGIGADSDLRVAGSWQDHVAQAETVIHLAAVLNNTRNIASFKDNMDMLVNVVSAGERANRLIYASSMWAVHHQTGLGARGDYYSASKRAGEALLHGWSDVHRKPSVSMRLGQFGSPRGSVPIEHELLRVDEAALRWWFDRAIAYDEPFSVAWQAIGLSNHL